MIDDGLFRDQAARGERSPPLSFRIIGNAEYWRGEDRRGLGGAAPPCTVEILRTLLLITRSFRFSALGMLKSLLQRRPEFRVEKHFEFEANEIREIIGRDPLSFLKIVRRLHDGHRIDSTDKEIFDRSIKKWDTAALFYLMKHSSDRITVHQNWSFLKKATELRDVNTLRSLCFDCHVTDRCLMTWDSIERWARANRYKEAADVIKEHHDYRLHTIAKKLDEWNENGGLVPNLNLLVPFNLEGFEALLKIGEEHGGDFEITERVEISVRRDKDVPYYEIPGVKRKEEEEEEERRKKDERERQSLRRRRKRKREEEKRDGDRRNDDDESVERTKYG